MKTLRMEFSTVEGKKYSVSLPYAKDDLTEAQVRPVMELMVQKGFLAAPVNGVSGCSLVGREVNRLF
ncbi:DUF2922 domain-containing protein [Thermanaerovibrio acidaminovorans]|jgi:hypothetical protein|uniref:DUF2922 domain-containing protein n=1 Tax=Thermanaerovibrio acidaminovorans (strain ATCC 49978 / DSM 6589 / Su883) TaxID=525903 RepID=D1B713_THEAS|nr:DUF2922 domain-containing protein [Thermanaerovibrio acidaminovorans]ACZ19804.1 hypothetical protein Taci_1583 [Thermanaerovibrio acidaminovorans DSM 6589]